MEYRLISADSHFIEPPNLWKDWLPAKYQDIAPKLVKDADGGDAWDYGAGEPSPLGIYAAAGKNEHNLKWTGVTYETMHQGYFKGEPRLKEQDADGVDAEVIFSSGRMLGYFYRMKDDQAQLAGLQALNNWIFQEFCKPNPNRLIGLAYIPAIGAEAAAAELERCAKMGAKGAAIVCWPSGNDALSKAEDPFWAKAEELQIPIHIHVRLTPRFAPAPKATGQQGGDIPGLATTGMLDMPKFMGQMIISEVFDRFPKLQMVGVEAGCGWIPYFLEQLDDRYWRNRKWAGCNLKFQPSDYYRSNWHSTFMKDSYALENRHRIGVDNLMWSTDYPHHGCEWPYSRKQIRETAIGVPSDELHKILAGNAVKLYKLQ